MKIMKVYLAGPINDCDDNTCKVWRNEAKELLKGFITLDPMDRDYRGTEDINPHLICNQDLDDIDDSNIILVNTTHGPSWGTAMELMYAWLENKTIVSIVNTGKNVISPWIMSHTDYIFYSLEDACEFINSLIRL